MTKTEFFGKIAFIAAIALPVAGLLIAQDKKDGDAKRNETTPIEVQRTGERPTYKQPTAVDPKETTLPLEVEKGEKIVLSATALPSA